MQLLFHTDFLLAAIGSEGSHPACGDKLLDLCRQKKIKGWVLSSSIPAIAGQNREAALDRLEDWLAALSILPCTANEIRGSLADTATGFEESLAALAVKAFRLQGIVTLDPKPFAQTGVEALMPEGALELLNTKAPVSSVPLVDLAASWHEIWADVEQGITEVICSGQFILGPKVAELEEKIAAYCQCKYAVGVSSGTDALLIALMAADVGPGDEVITSPYTFFATAGSIARLGARPVLVDIEPFSYNIDPQQVQEKITGKTKAILPVHLFGQCADMDPILELAKKHDLPVIEDAAQAIGSEYKFRRAGSLGDYGCFSFFPTKNLGGFGDGGIVTTSSEEACERLKLLRAHGAKPKYQHKVIGGNFRLDALQAAVVAAKLPYLEGWTEKRRQNAENYNRLFERNHLLQKIQVPMEMFPRHIYNQYVIRISEQRDDLLGFLKEKNIGAEVYYPIPLHLQECFASLGYKQGDFPEAEKAAAETLALPISHEVTAAQQEHVIATIREFFA